MTSTMEKFEIDMKDTFRSLASGSPHLIYAMEVLP